MYRQARELDFYELFGVERAMPVLGSSHWLRQHSPCRVCSLPDVMQIDSACDLLHNPDIQIHRLHMHKTMVSGYQD